MRGRTQEECKEDRENMRRTRKTWGEDKKKHKDNEVEDKGRPSSLLGVARVHLIYWTLRNAEGATPKLHCHFSEALALWWALRQVLQPHIASHNTPMQVMTSCDISLRHCDVSSQCSNILYGGSRLVSRVAVIREIWLIWPCTEMTQNTEIHANIIYMSGRTSAVTWNTVDAGLEFVLGCYWERRAQYAEGGTEEGCESKREQGRSRSHSGPMSCLVRTEGVSWVDKI